MNRFFRRLERLPKLLAGYFRGRDGPAPCKEPWRPAPWRKKPPADVLAAALFLALTPLVLRADSIAEQDARFAQLPAGVSVLPEKGLTAFQLGGQGGAARLVPVDAQPFREAQQIRTATRPANPWGLQLGARTAVPIKQGDRLLAIFFVRGTECPADTDEARTEFVFELAGGANEKSSTYPIVVGAAWRKFYIPFTAKTDSAPNEAQIMFRAGYDPQVIEIGGVQLFDYGPAVPLADLPYTPLTYRGREADAPWRAAAAERIEKLRKGDLTITVTRGGQPVPGAEVHVKMTRHAFAFGSAVDAKILLQSGPDADRYRAVILENFNKVVLENDLKWQGWEKDRATGLAAVAWLRAHGIAVRGHCLVWPGWKNLPKKLEPLAASPDTLRQTVLDHIADELGALRGQCTEWDVVNEAFNNTDLQTVLTGVKRDSAPDWIERHAVPLADWFRAAHAADLAAKLDINDYSILSSGGHDTPHQDHYFRTIRALLAIGAPVQGIGLQSHFAEDLTPPARLLEILDRFATLGLPLQGTEHDINLYDEQVQADYTRDYLTVMFSHPSVIGVLTWGFWEKRHWIPAAAYYRADWSLRPAGQVWQNLVRKTWWTDTTAPTGDQGAISLRAYLGDYEITARAAGLTKTISAKLSKYGAKITVELAP